MFSRIAPEGRYCQLCNQQAIIEVYLYGDSLEDAIKRYDPDIRLCEYHLSELCGHLQSIPQEAKRMFMILRRAFLRLKEGKYSQTEFLHFLAGFCLFAPEGDDIKLLSVNGS